MRLIGKLGETNADTTAETEKRKKGKQELGQKEKDKPCTCVEKQNERKIGEIPSSPATVSNLEMGKFLINFVVFLQTAGCPNLSSTLFYLSLSRWMYQTRWAERERIPLFRSHYTVRPFVRNKLAHGWMWLVTQSDVAQVPGRAGDAPQCGGTATRGPGRIPHRLPTRLTQHIPCQIMESIDTKYHFSLVSKNPEEKVGVSLQFSHGSSRASVPRKE